MKRLTAMMILGLSLFMWAGQGICAGGPVTTLWEDPQTGQIFTRPAEGRVPVDPVADLGMPDAALSGLYQDEDGALYSKPAEGRTPVAVASTAPGAVTAADAAGAAADTHDEDALADKVLAKLPSWVRNTKVKGDLRLRYDLENRVGKEDNHRGRYRYRLFVETPVNDWFKVHIMLASGSDDPKSANQTLGGAGGFEAPDFRLREAYAEFTPFDWLTVLGGQMENVLYRPSDGVWDKDIKPTGGGVAVDYKKDGWMAEPFMNAALYVIQQESGSPNDPFMYVMQPGVKLNLTSDVHMKLAAAYYGYESVKGAALAHADGGNTTMPGGFLVYDYDGFVISSELGIKKPVGFVPYLGLFGEYAYNFDPDVLNQGYIVGMTVGDKSVKKQGQWQLGYSWRRMEADAILDILPDSDAFGGHTNITGHEIIAKYGLFDKVELGLDYYRLREITTDIDEDRLQIDFVLSF